VPEDVNDVTEIHKFELFDALSVFLEAVGNNVAKPDILELLSDLD
jgi:hypothetical protein